MNKRLLLLISFFVVLSAQVTAQQSTLNVRTFGAVPNDGKDDSKAFQKALEQANTRGGSNTILVPAGTYNIDTRLTMETFTGNLTFAGESGTKIICSSNGGFIYLKAVSQELKLKRSAKRNESAISCQQSGGWQITEGDLVNISSSTAFETGWKYKENDIMRVKSFRFGQLQLADKLLFNYDPAAEKVKVTVYKKCSLSIKDIDLLLLPSAETEKNRKITMLVLVGMSINMENSTLKYTGKQGYFHMGLSALACEGVNFRKIGLNNLMYAILLNYCRNVKAYDTKAENLRHAYTPTQACYNVYIEKLRGLRCQSVIDAHVSFLVHYKDVVDSLMSEFPNCRALGTIVEDSRFIIRDDYYQVYCYWSVQTLVPEYKFLYGEYDTQFRNVHWVTKKPGNFNGITSFSCRKFIVDNCTTHNVAFYGDQQYLEDILITNSRVAVIRIDGQKTVVKNTILDGSLAPTATYVFRFRGAGQTRFENVTVKNYNKDSVYLFDYFYNQQYMNQISISNSKIGPLRGWTNKFLYPGKAYPVVSLSSTTIAPFKENMPKELTTLPAELMKARPR